MTTSLHIEVGGCRASYQGVQNVIHALYPQEEIHWELIPSYHEIDTYVILYLCPYDTEELPLLSKGFLHAKEIFDRKLLKPDTRILIIFYRDVKVAFPDRKLQREKAMSEMASQEMLQSFDSSFLEHIRITHEFGTNNLQDSIRQLIGSRHYIEVIPQNRPF